jgi:hypothetical protein
MGQELAPNQDMSMPLLVTTLKTRVRKDDINVVINVVNQWASMEKAQGR